MTVKTSLFPECNRLFRADNQRALAAALRTDVQPAPRRAQTPSDYVYGGGAGAVPANIPGASDASEGSSTYQDFIDLLGEADKATKGVRRTRSVPVTVKPRRKKLAENNDRRSGIVEHPPGSVFHREPDDSFQAATKIRESSKVKET